MRGLQFRKRFKIGPWMAINLSKSGTSLSVGPSNFHVTAGKRGTWLYVDLPGSGAYYRKKISSADSKSSDSDKENGSAEPEEQQAQKFDLSPLQRLVKSNSELHLVDALRALEAGDEAEALAYQHAAQAASLADGAFLAGVLALKQEDNQKAVDYLLHALKLKDSLGKHLASL